MLAGSGGGWVRAGRRRIRFEARWDFWQGWTAGVSAGFVSKLVPCSCGYKVVGKTCDYPTNCRSARCFNEFRRVDDRGQRTGQATGSFPSRQFRRFSMRRGCSSTAISQRPCCRYWKSGAYGVCSSACVRFSALALCFVPLFFRVCFDSVLEEFVWL